MVTYYPDLLRHSFFRAPDWRWRRACWLVGRGRYFSRRRDDTETGRAVHYLQAQARRRPGDRLAALKQLADVGAACRLHECRGQTTLLIQARLLARQGSAEIGRLTGVPARVIDTYESLFFSCRDRLDAGDWILAHAIGMRASAKESGPDRGVVLKSFAYFGGPLALEAVSPYLVGGKDLFDPAADLSTSRGRQEHVVRLALAAHMLPRDAAADETLHKIMLLVREMDRQRAGRRRPGAPLAGTLDSRLQELAAGGRDSEFSRAKSTAAEMIWSPAAQSAKAG